MLLRLIAVLFIVIELIWKLHGGHRALLLAEVLLRRVNVSLGSFSVIIEDVVYFLGLDRLQAVDAALVLAA